MLNISFFNKLTQNLKLINQFVIKKSIFPINQQNLLITSPKIVGLMLNMSVFMKIEH